MTETVKKGWTKVSFGDVVERVNETGIPNSTESRRYIGLEHMESESLTIYRWGSDVDLVVPKTLIKEGDVLFARRNTHLRRCAVAPFDTYFSPDGYAFRSKSSDLLQELLIYIVASDNFMSYAVEHSSGTHSKRVKWSDLVKYEFVLPPMEEQVRLASLFSLFDKLLNKKNKLTQKLEYLFQALLEDFWESSDKIQINNLVKDNVIYSPQDGNHGEKHPRATDYSKIGIPFIMASDIESGTVNYKKCKRIPKKIAENLRVGFAKQGDILISHKGTIGLVTKLKNISDDYVILTPQVTYYRIKDFDSLHPDWLYYSFKTPSFQKMLKQFSRQSTRSYIGITAQKDLLIPYTSYANQLSLLKPLSKLELALLSNKKGTELLDKARNNLLNTIFVGASGYVQ